MTHHVQPKGVCSRRISFEIDDNGTVHNVTFEGGCNGNTQGIARLAEGMPAEELIRRLRGIHCGMRSSSCPDQLAAAVENAIQSSKSGV